MGDRVWVQFPVRDIYKCDQPPRSIQPGHPFVGRCNEYQPKGSDALRLGVKAGMVRVWVTGKTVWSPCYTWAISERFRDKAVCKFNCLLYRYVATFKLNRWIYIALYFKPFISKALRYGPCVTRGSHNFTCHSHMNHTCLYSPAARRHHSPPFGWHSLRLPTKGWPGWVEAKKLCMFAW